MSLLDFLHSDNTDLPNCNTVKHNLDDAWNVTLVSKKSKIIALGRHLLHDARFAGRHLADDGGEDRTFSMSDALHFEIGIEQSLTAT